MNFLRFPENEKEEQFLVFLRKRVSGKLALLPFVAGLMALFGEMGTWKTRELGGYAFIGLSFAILVGFVGALVQVVIAVLDRFGAVRTSRLLVISEIMMVTLVFSLLITDGAVLMFVFMPSGCNQAGRELFEVDSGKVFASAKCDKILLPFGIIGAFLLVILQHRFFMMIVLAALMLIHNFVAIFTFPVPDSTPSIHVISFFYSAAMVYFACFVRYEMETSERRYFNQHLELQQKLEELQRKNDELKVFMRRLVPPVIMDRINDKSVSKKDVADNAVIAVISVEDFQRQSEKFTPQDLAELVAQTDFHVDEFAMSLHMQRVSSLNDEIVVVGNLIDRQDPTRTILSACSLLEEIIDLIHNVGGLPLRGAVHIGPLRGGFHGNRWIRYDVVGPALDACRSYSLHATAGQIVLSTDAYFVAKEYVEAHEDATIAVENPNSMLDGSVESGSANDVQLFILDKASSVDNYDQVMSAAGQLVATFGETKSVSKDSSSDDMKMSVSGNKTVLASSGSFGAPHLRQLQIATAIAEQDDESETFEYKMQSKWCCFMTFVEERVEQEYLKRRMHTMVRRAARIWAAFAWLQLIFVALLVGDFHPSTGPLALILLLVSIALTIVVALVPVFSNSMDRLHTPWSMLAMVTPLLTAFALAVSRPSAIGVFTMPMMFVAAMVRVPCFYYERHQLVVIPLFTVLFSFSVVLPGGYISVPYILGWFMVLYIVVSSGEADLASRVNFVVEHRLEVAMDALDQEQDVRSGLIRNTLPTSILLQWEKGKLTSRDSYILVAPDTIVAVVTCSSSQSFGQDTLKPVEEAADLSGLLNIVKIVGNVAVLAAPVAVPNERYEESVKQCMENLGDILKSLLALTTSGDYGVLLDIDTSVQALELTSSLPKFSLIGVVLTRLLAVLGAKGGVLRGLSVLEHIVLGIRPAMEKHGLCSVIEPPMRVRGAGQLRISKIEPGTSTAN